MKSTDAIVAAVLAAVFLAACGTAPAVETPEPETPAAGDPDLSLDWTVVDCEGEAPILCVMDGDRVVGTVEYVDYPAEGDGDLRARIADYLHTMGADRTAYYGPGYAFTTQEPVDVTIAGLGGLRYGFTVSAADGSVVERHVSSMTIVDDVVWVVVASGYADQSEHGAFAPTDLQLFAPSLDRVVAQRPLPVVEDDGREARLGDGDHLGYLRQIDLEMGVVMLDLVEWVALPDETPEWRVDDPDDTWHLGQLAGDVAVTVIDCTQACESVGATIGELAGGAAKAFNGGHALFDVVVADGLVVSIDERYVP